MINVTPILFVIFTFASTFTAIGAVPTHQSRDIFSPPILYPNAATAWFAGQRHNVTWDPSNPPKTISNSAFILLRTANINEFPPVTLAANFSLLDGRHEIQVPANAASRDDYMITLFGDGANVSPAFTILAS